MIKKIALSLMDVPKQHITLFYHTFIFNIITSNSITPSGIMLEHLPTYIVNCLQNQADETISDYNQVKNKAQKYYLVEFIIQLMLTCHEEYLANRAVQR